MLSVYVRWMLGLSKVVKLRTARSREECPLLPAHRDVGGGAGQHPVASLDLLQHRLHHGCRLACKGAVCGERLNTTDSDVTTPTRRLEHEFEVLSQAAAWRHLCQDPSWAAADVLE